MKKKFLIYSLLFTILLLSSCASSRIRGTTPVQRAHSAADLLITGSTSDAYIKQFNIEMSLAIQDINDKKARTNISPQAYEIVADEIDDWIKLYDLIAVLENRYPSGLLGKKQTAFFKYVDYRPLKEEANTFTAQKYFNQAVSIAEKPHTLNEAMLALDYLNKSLHYSNHLLNESKELGADLAYKAALELYETKTSESLKKAYNYFLEADKWLPDYEDARQRASALKPEIAQALISEADSLLSYQDYQRLRLAYQIYEEAYSYAPSYAEKKIQETKDKLTITVAVIFSGTNSNFAHDIEIRNQIKKQIENSSEGPLFVEIDFIHAAYTTANHAAFLSTIVGALKNQSTAIKKNYKNYDLLLIPGPKFNTVIESIENPEKDSENLAKYYRQTSITNLETGIKETSVTEVSINEYKKQKSNYEDNTKSYEFSYWKDEGNITRYTQKVSLFIDYSYELYDIRNNSVSYIINFDQTGDSLDLQFSQESYSGAKALEPEKLKNDTFYEKGQHVWYSYKIPSQSNPYQIIDSSFNTLNENGKKLIRQIQKLRYIAK